MQYKRTSVKKNKRHKIITLFLTILFSAGLIYSVVNIILCKLDTDRATTQATALNQSAQTIKGIDFKKLKALNPETQGWLQVKGTDINYAFVKHADNKYYLTHSFDQTSNRAGWIFLDYRNDLDRLSKNTIIYGHGFYKTIMFGTLKNVLKKSWYSNRDNQIITLKTEKGTTLWQVFSVYHIKNTSDYIKTSFPNDKNYQSFLDLIKNRSLVQFDLQPTAKDKILTLSTCYDRSERLVLHAKLLQPTQK